MPHALDALNSGKIDRQMEACFADEVLRKAREFYEEAEAEPRVTKVWIPSRDFDVKTASPLICTPLPYVASAPQARLVANVKRSFVVYGHMATEAGTRHWEDCIDRLGDRWKVVQCTYSQKERGPRNERLRTLANLSQNWDGYESGPITQVAIRRADDIVHRGMEFGIGIPRIAPITGGGIELEWSVGKRDLEMEILPDGRLEFVRMFEDGRMEGNDDVPSADAESLLHWLSEEANVVRR